MNAEQQKALDKIKKCLKLSGSSNAHEAAAAMRQAQALMEKYALDFDDIAASEVNIHNQNATVKKTPVSWESSLANLCGKAFSCKTILISFGGVFNSQWQFIGCGSAPELAGYAFTALARQLKKDRAAYIKTKLSRCGPKNKTARADQFSLAWVWGVKDQLNAMVVNDKAETAITAYMAKHHPSLENLKPRVNAGTAAANWKDADAGEKAGRAARLHRGVNGGNQQQTLEHIA